MCEGWPQHRGLRPLLFSNSGVGSFTSHKNRSVKVLWDRTYGFLSLPEKTRKSNHWQMSLQRQHFLLSYWKTLSVALVRPGFEPVTSRSPDPSLPTELTRGRFCSLLIAFYQVPLLNKPSQQEGNLHAHACIRWTTISWVHQIWWREIENTGARWWTRAWIVRILVKIMKLGRSV